jgi:DNA primase
MARSNSPGHVDTDVLKRQRPLADVIASYGVTLRREGNGTFRGLCPFHHEHTPSFWVDVRDPNNEHYFCFGQCGAHGDVITFVMEREACTFAEACAHLGAHDYVNGAASLAATRLNGGATGRSWESLDPSTPHGLTLDLVLRLYEAQLWDDRRALTYLRRRAIPEDLARTQRLGYANGRTLVGHLRRGGEIDGQTPLALAVELGLVVERTNEEDNASPLRKEFFFDRLIVPELRGGQPIWFIGRAVEDSTTHPDAILDAATPPAKRARPKYLSLSGEKPVLGLEHVAGQPSAYLVEGPVDWLAALSWSLPAFAICGTHFPADRLPALREARAIYGVFDPDRAGRTATERHAPLFGSRWRPVHLPNNLDLADLAAHGDAGRETFRVLVGRARAAAWQNARV